MAKQKTKTREQASYRIVPEMEDGLELHLSDATGRSFEGQISNLDAHGVSAFFDQVAAPSLPIGLGTVISLVSPNLPRPVEVSAVVVGRSEGWQRRRYGFQFQGDMMLSHDRLRELVNRRGAFRVTPRGGDDVDVRVSSVGDDPRELAIGRLTDVSGTGMGLLALPDVDGSLAGREYVEVSFALPGGSGSTVMLARIVTRYLEGRFVRFGLRFDGQRTPDFRGQQKQIFRYVVRRQQQDIQRERPDDAAAEGDPPIS